MVYIASVGKGIPPHEMTQNDVKTLIKEVFKEIVLYQNCFRYLIMHKLKGDNLQKKSTGIYKNMALKKRIVFT